MLKWFLALLTLFTALTLGAQERSLFLSHEALSPKLYVGQRVAIDLKAIVATSNFDAIRSQFKGAHYCTVLNPDAPWKALTPTEHTVRYYIQIDGANATLPIIDVSLFAQGGPKEQESITLPAIHPIKLKEDPLFSNVIAQNLAVNKYKTSVFDPKHVIMVLEIEATMANLKAFRIKNIPKNGVDSFSEDGETQRIYYYAILPNYQKNFEFSYFDLPTNRFVKITLPVVVESDEISTQLGLNPKESTFAFYKQVSYATAGALFFLLFLRRRRIIYLLLIALFIGLYLIDKNPLNKATLKSQSHLSILPTDRSTLFFTAQEALRVERLAEYGTYIKVLLPDGTIGWTARENISTP